MGLIARHARPAELENVSLEEIARRYVARFAERKPDWHAFADAAIPGYRRAQHRFIGNTSGKPDANLIPARAFTLSVMYVQPGEGNASHTHEVEEVFFVLQGRLIVFFEEEDGRHLEVALGPWDCVSCPPGGRDPRLSQRRRRAGLPPGDGWKGAAGIHGLCRPYAIRQPRRPHAQLVNPLEASQMNANGCDHSAAGASRCAASPSRCATT